MSFVDFCFDFDFFVNIYIEPLKNCAQQGLDFRHFIVMMVNGESRGESRAKVK